MREYLSTDPRRRRAGCAMVGVPELSLTGYELASMAQLVLQAEHPLARPLRAKGQGARQGYGIANCAGASRFLQAPTNPPLRHHAA